MRVGWNGAQPQILNRAADGEMIEALPIMANQTKRAVQDNHGDCSQFSFEGFVQDGRKNSVQFGGGPGLQALQCVHRHLQGITQIAVQASFFHVTSLFSFAMSNHDHRINPRRRHGKID